MAVITLRSVKGSPLTIAEADANIANINTELGGKLDITTYTAADILTKLLTVDGSGSGLDADKLQGKTAVSTNTANSLVLRDAQGNFSAGSITGTFYGNITGNIVGNGTGVWSGPASSVSGVVSVDHGGTGSTTVEGIKSTLNMGSMASQYANNVTITGGSITNIAPLAISDGGTGANNISSARTNLGLVVGVDVQPYAPILSTISAIVDTGFVAKTGPGSSSARTLTAGTNISITNGDGISGNPTISLVSNVALSGTPTAPTATAGTNTTQLATTAFVKDAVTTATNSLESYTDTKFDGVLGTAKAFVVFNGTTGSIVASRNVSSVTSDSAGQYTINLVANTFTNGNYAAVGTCTTTSSTGKFVTVVSSTASTLVINTMSFTYSFGSGTVSSSPSQNTSGVVRIAIFS